MFFEGNQRFYVAGAASIWEGDPKPGVETATAEWARPYIIENTANSYILGKYCEAERPNDNLHYFKLGDLLDSQPTISYSPLNINHQSDPVGSFIASAMQYPLEDADHPYIEALSAMWKQVFPTAFAMVENAHAMGRLFFSMEAIPASLSTVGGTDDTIEYAYEGRQSPNYPEEINSRSVDGLVLNKPHFVGGALVVPPARPGWSKANIKEISAFVKDQWETAELIYEGAKDATPHLDAKTWEFVMGELILMALEEQAAEEMPMKKKKMKKMPPKEGC